MLTTEKVNEILKTLGDGDLCLDQNNHCVIMTGRDEDAFAAAVCPALRHSRKDA